LQQHYFVLPVIVLSETHFRGPCFDSFTDKFST
jgi:hypothetical protein